MIHLAHNTAALTDSLTPFDCWPTDNEWLVARIVFLMEVQDGAPEYFFAKTGQTVDEMLKNCRKSLSRELLELRDKYPKHYKYAQNKHLSNWLKGVSDGGSCIC